MFTLTILNFVFTAINHLYIFIFRGAVPTLDSLNSFITNYSVPQTLIDSYSLCVLFLPIGTLSTLFTITLIIVIIKILIAAVHFLSAGLMWGE